MGALACQAKDAKPITLLSRPVPMRVIAAPSQAPPAPPSRGHVGESIQLAQLTELPEPTGGEPATALPADVVPDPLEGQIAQLENYISEFPDAPLTPAIRVELAEDYRRQGRISRSLDHWLEAWAATRAARDGEAKDLADYSLAELAHTLARMGRIEELELLMSQNNERTLDYGRLSSLWAQTREALAFVKRNPSFANRCGIYALSTIANRLSGQRLSSEFLPPASPEGLSLDNLQQLADANRLGLVAAVRSEGASLVIPSLVHWKRQHYATILAEAIGGFLVVDPTFADPVVMSIEAIEEEASGYFLIPKDQLPPGWRLADPAEKAQVHGRYLPTIPLNDNEPPPCNDDCCDEQGGGGGSGPAGTGSETNECGMATWRITEPYMNLTVIDIPMKYHAAYGPDFVLALRWRQRSASMPYLGPYSHLSAGWYCDLFSVVTGDSAWNQGMNEATFNLVNGEGYKYTLHFASGSVYSDRTYANNIVAKRTVSGSTVTVIEAYYSNGAYEKYELITTQSYYRITLRKDATLQSMLFNYDAPLSAGVYTRLRSVVTADGKQFNFNYPSSGDLHRLLSLDGPDYRTVTFGYSSYGILTNITDVVGLQSSFSYNSNGWITNLTTPYGSTGFTHQDAGTVQFGSIDRSTVIQEPLGARQIYLFYYSPPTGVVPQAFSGSQVPVYPEDDPEDPPIRTIDTLRNFFNSHHWNRQQAAQVPANLTAFGASDYLISRTRHWLEQGVGAGDIQVSGTLSWELPPSADGVNEAQPVFYDYPAKPGSVPNFRGTNSTPSLIVQNRYNSNGWTMWYQYIQRNHRGMRTNVKERLVLKQAR